MKNIIKTLLCSLLIMGSLTNASQEHVLFGRASNKTASIRKAPAVQATSQTTSSTSTSASTTTWQDTLSAAWQSIVQPAVQSIITFFTDNPKVAAISCATVGLVCVTRTLQHASTLNAQVAETFKEAKDLADNINTFQTSTPPASAHQISSTQKKFISELKQRYAGDLIDNEHPLQFISRKLNATITRLKRAQSIFLLPGQKQAIKDNIAALELILKTLTDTGDYQNEPKSTWFGRLFSRKQ